MKLGTRIERVLSSFGVTPEEVERYLGRPCGCEERKRRLDEFGAWARRVVSGRLDGMRERLYAMLS